MTVTTLLVALGTILLLALALARLSIRVLREYERGVTFRLGRLIDQKGPGLLSNMPTPPIELERRPATADHDLPVAA